MPENKLKKDELQERIRQAPFHKWLDLNVKDVTEEGIVVSVGWREEFVVNAERGYSHGGILATVIDVAADYALAAKLGRPLPTIDMRIDYHRPAMQGELTAKARVIKLGGSLCTAEAEIFDGDGRLLASGRGVYYSG